MDVERAILLTNFSDLSHFDWCELLKSFVLKTPKVEPCTIKLKTIKTSLQLEFCQSDYSWTFNDDLTNPLLTKWIKLDKSSTI